MAMAQDEILAPFRPGGHNHRACVADALKAAEEICRDRGLRLTPLRRRILELIWSGHEPVRAYDLLDKLRGERRGAAPPTVYRTLDFLCDCGLVHRIESLNAYVGCGDPRFDHAGQFLICRGCRAVAELDAPEITEAIADKARRAGFEVAGQTIEIAGLCPDCQVAGAAGGA